MHSFAFTSTNWALKLAKRIIKADVRVHNLDVLDDDMAIIYVVNHFTRLETFLLPYEFYKHTGKVVWSLGANELFSGRIGRYLRKMGTISTEDPDRDKVIVHSLLEGNNPWIIFPEGQMIKDKKVIDPAGVFSVYNRGKRRPPHRGAAALALRAEFYRRKLQCIYDRPNLGGLEETFKSFGLESPELALQKRTVVVPVNITYFPIRARTNVVLRMARIIARDLSDRALEELSVEGTFLSADTDIDITLGEPIDVASYLDRPEYAELMACGDDRKKLETDLKPLFRETARQMMRSYMGSIYGQVRVNYDHIFATLIRYQGSRAFTERSYRNRIFLCVHALIEEGKHHLHTLLESTYRAIIYEDPSAKFADFISLSTSENVLCREGTDYRRVPGARRGKAAFHAVRAEETTWVIANEVEPLDGFTDLVKKITKASRKDLSRSIREIFEAEDQKSFEDDYQTYRSKESHHMDVGRPFLLQPDRIKEGIVLVHGYLAAPREVHAFARYLCDRGMAVYGVRLKGHGTAPEDLRRTTWGDWYESVNRGYTIIKSLTDNIVLGGFSTGGNLALMGAGLKGASIRAAFSVCAPLKLQRFAAKLAPSVVTMNTLLRRVKKGDTGWEYVENSPENADINYSRNPLRGVRELGRVMAASEEQLQHICVPTLVVQGSRDPIVHPTSGQEIFDQVGTPLKELAIFERDRHGIINGEGAEDIFERVYRFLVWARDKRPAAPVPEEREKEERQRLPRAANTS